MTPERFHTRVDRSGGPAACWPYRGQRGTNYAEVKAVGERRAHRIAWVLANGPIPAGLWVLHRCDNRPCCNPAHLFLGTAQINHADMVSKGRARGGSSAGESHPMHVLTSEQVAAIRAAFTGARGQQTALARTHGVSLSTIHLIVRGRTWAPKPQHHKGEHAHG